MLGAHPLAGQVSSRVLDLALQLEGGLLAAVQIGHAVAHSAQGTAVSGHQHVDGQWPRDLPASGGRRQAQGRRVEPRSASPIAPALISS